MKSRSVSIGLMGALLLGAMLPARSQSTTYTYDASGRLTAVAALAPGAPAITAQPVTQVIAEDGDASFSVVANGPGPLSYQWLSNGIPIPGENGDVLTITNVVIPRNVMSNGGFEMPQVLANFATYAAGQSFGGWSVETGSVDQIYTLWHPSEGMQSIELNGAAAGSIYQDVPTSPGQQYFLRFALAGNLLAGFVIKTNAVWWNDVVLDTNTFVTTGHSINDMGWSNLEYSVTATSNTTRVRFVSLTAGNAGPAVDDVTLIPAAPPAVNYSVMVSNTSGSVTSAVATIQLDTDHNGLPDSWERIYFGATGQRADGDSDGDGVLNLEEFREGTNPTNPASLRPRLNLFATPGGTISTQPAEPSYTLDETVQLHALPDPGCLFFNWSGAVTGTSTSANLVMDATKTVSAIFGTVLSNGAGYAGTLPPGATNLYGFYANAGDSYVLQIGETAQDNANFYPQIVIYGPDGALLASAADVAGVYLTGRMTNSGTFVVQAKSFYAAGLGSYRLNLALAPGNFVVSPGDEGGAMTNGASYTGSLPVGDLDLWSFNGNSGDNFIVQMGEITQSNSTFYPQIFLYGPDGVLLARDSAAAGIYVTTRATNSGTFTVVVNSLYDDGAGTYRVNLARAPGPGVVSPGDEGGTLTNGASYDGSLSVGDLDVWNFAADAGDSIVVEMGEVSQSGVRFYPDIFLYGPDGAQLDRNSTASSAIVSTRATNSGTFTVAVNSYYPDGAGTYRLSLAKAPGAFVVSPGDEGGPLVNGGNHDGTTDLGDVDLWNFDANAGDSVVLRCADISTNTSYFPWLRVYGPDGALLGQDADNADSFVSFRATNSGTFTVTVDGFYAGYSGDYRLRLAKMPGAFIVPPGDEGGVLSAQSNYDETIDLGDEDMWTFTAYKGNGLTLRSQKLSGQASFNPWIRLYGPNGALLATAVNASVATINYTPTNNGTFTLLMGSGNQGFSGTYRLSGTNVSEGLKITAPGRVGPNFNFSVAGGGSNVLFVLLTATNVTQPVPLWAPIETNHFDAAGSFSFTNLFDPGQPEHYFRLSVP